MSTSWDDFYAEVRREAADHNDAQDLDAWEQHFRNELSLIRMREAAGLTQRQLSSRARVEQAEISRIEQGKGNPTLKTLLRLAAACGARIKIELPNDAGPSQGINVAARRRVAIAPQRATATKAASPGRKRKPATRTSGGARKQP